MRKTIPTALAVLACALLGAQFLHEARGDDKRFQLVYHSDNRGYYQPCG